MDVSKLKKLFLLGCEQLRSLIWHGSPRLKVLHVDTQRKTRSMVSCGEQGSFGIEACIAFTDGRFIWSFFQGLDSSNYDCLSKVYLLISCMSHIQASITKGIKDISSSRQGLVPTRSLLTYNDIYLAKDVTRSSLVWNCELLQTLNLHIEIGEGSYNFESMQDSWSFRILIAWCWITSCAWQFLHHCYPSYSQRIMAQTKMVSCWEVPQATLCFPVQI